VRNRRDFTTRGGFESNQAFTANPPDRYEPIRQRRKHQEEVQSYLQKHIQIDDWSFSLPLGSGMETYFAEGNGQQYFVKVGAPVERYLTIAEAGLTPPIITHGKLESDLSIIVQPFVDGRKPSSRDFCDQLDNVAASLHILHRNTRTRETLSAISFDSFKDAGWRALNQLLAKWEKHRAQVSTVADFVDRSLDRLSQDVTRFSGEGLVASHNDICNANWLFAANGKIYLVDFESMSMDDPAADLGALLWWYYPPDLRGRFLELAGYRYDDAFEFRMRVRMAIHCLSIILPREGSFDRFDPERFHESLRDFRTVLDGKENPEGYEK